MPREATFHASRLAIWALAALLAACSAPAPASLPTPPPIPEGWNILVGGGVEVAIPAEWGPDLDGVPGSIVTSAFFDPAATNGVGIFVHGPRLDQGEQPEPPFTDERLADWLQESIYERPSTSFRSVVLLPAGRAVQFRATYYAGKPGATEVAAFAIPTAVGVVYLQIIIDSDLMGRYGSTLQTIPMLLDLSPGDGSSPAP